MVIYSLPRQLLIPPILGTFSVIPRVAAGEITPDKLIVLGQVAKKCRTLVAPYTSS